MIRKLFVLTLILLFPRFLVAQSDQLKKLDDKYGFKTLKFEMSKDSILPFNRNVDVTTSGDKKDSVSTYFLFDEKFKSLGDANIESVAISFYKDRLYLVVAFFKGTDNFNRVSEILRGQFGVPKQPNRYLDQFVWEGDRVLLNFDKNPVKKDSSMQLKCKSLIALIQKDRAEKASNAGKEF